MIVTYCRACNKTIYVAENPQEQRLDPRSTKYWSYEKDGSKRPYCDAACALVEYQKKK